MSDAWTWTYLDAEGKAMAGDDLVTTAFPSQSDAAHHRVHRQPATDLVHTELGHEQLLEPAPHQEPVDHRDQQQDVDGDRDDGEQGRDADERQGEHHEHDGQHELADVPAGIDVVTDVAAHRALVACGEVSLVAGHHRGP